MSDYREARERAGLSLDDVAAKTKIPVKWLEALESGNTGAFPPGPFLGGYSRQYRAFLGLGEAAPVAGPPPSRPLPEPRPAPASRRTAPAAGATGEPTETTTTIPGLRTSRRARAAVAGVLAAAALVSFVVLGGGVRGEADPAVGVPPDLVLLVTSASGVGANVTADGRTLHEGKLPAGKQVKFAAHDRLEVELDELKGVTLVYNGSTLRPLGAQSRPRRMVFEDDRGG